MSSESFQSDNISSTEDIELTEFVYKPDIYSDSGSSADIPTSCKWPKTQAETSVDEANDSAISILNCSDENHALDISRTSLRSLEGSSTLTRKASSLDGPIGKVSSINTLEGPSTRRGSSLNSLEGPSSMRDSSLNPLEKPMSTRVLSLDPLEGPSIRRVSSLNPLEVPSSRKVSSLDLLKRSSSMQVSSLETLETPTVRRVLSPDPLKRSSSTQVASSDSLKRSSSMQVSSLDTLETPTVRRVLSQDPLKRSSSMQVLSSDPLKRSSFMQVSSSDSLKRSSSMQVSPSDTLERPTARRVSSLDPLEGPSTRRVSSLDPLEGPSTRRVSSLDPLEGPSNRTDWFSGSAEDLFTSVFQLHHSETEANEHSDSESPTEQNGYCLGNLARRFRHSALYPWLLGVLILLPYSAGYMGCIYLHLCNGCPQLPFFLFVAGLLGTLILFLQLTSVLSKRYFSPRLTGQEFDTWMATLAFAFLAFWVFEICTTYTCKPVFIPPHEEFCLQVLYNYAYYANMVPPFVILLLMLIIIPSDNDPSET